MINIRPLLLINLFLFTLPASPARADLYTWTCDTSSSWQAVFCWDPSGTVPSSADTVYIGSKYYPLTGSGTVTINSVTGNADALNLYVSNSGSYSVNVNQTGGALSIGSEYIGDYGGAGSYSQSGGTHDVGTLYVGQSLGDNSYTLSGNGYLTAYYEYISNSGSQASGNFTQNGGVHDVFYLMIGGGLNNSGYYDLNDGNLSAGSLDIGFGGAGVFNQNGGTSVIANSISLGKLSGSSGIYNLNGGSLTVQGDIVNGTGGGILNIDGGTLTVNGANGINVDTLYVGTVNGGSHTLSSGNITVTGDEWIGFGAVGTIIQNENGGATSHDVLGNLFIGTGSPSTGSNYDLSNGSLTAHMNEYIGYSSSGQAAFTQSGGSHTVTGDLVLGNNSGTSGTYTATGGTLDVGGYLTVGLGGSGTLDAQSDISSTRGYVGRSSGSTGIARIHGASATWNNSDRLYIGDAGNGTLEITADGDVTNTYGYLGNAAGSTGSALVSGPGSTWMNNAALSVGFAGNGNLTVADNGLVTSTAGYLGYSPGSTGTVTVGGNDSTWDIGSFGLFVGGSSASAGGTGTLTVTAGGHVDTAGTLKLWAPGTVNLNGGTVTANALVNQGAFNFNAGTLNITSHLAMSALGTNTTLNGLKTLNVAGTTTLDGYATLTLDGGTFSTGSLVNNGGFTFNSGTFNLTGDNLTIGNSGLLGSRVLLEYGKEVNVTNTVNIDANAVLSMRGGRLTGYQINNSGTIDMADTLSELGGDTLNNNGLIHGTGTVRTAFINTATGEVRADAGEALSFTDVVNVNNGEINLTGGTARFGSLVNDTGGVINGRGTLVTDGGLTNRGSVNLSGGNSDIHGNVTNATGASMIVSGNSTASFYNDVTNNGTLFRVSEGSTAVIFGAFSGAGIEGTGLVRLEGGIYPGNSPGLMTMGGDVALGVNSLTYLELGGTLRGSEYDALDVGGGLFLDGVLEVDLYDLGSGIFNPQLGDSFDLFSAETITGNFDLLTLAVLGNGLDWDLDLLANASGSTDILRLSVVAASTVPVPPAVWLFGSGLLGLIAIARRRQPL